MKSLEMLVWIPPAYNLILLPEKLHMQTKGIDKEYRFRPGDTQSDVIENGFCPTQIIEDTIAGSKFDASLLLRLGDRNDAVISARFQIQVQTFCLGGCIHDS